LGPQNSLMSTMPSAVSKGAMWFLSNPWISLKWCKLALKRMTSNFYHQNPS
jgi:hypothetical protein